MSRKTGYRGIPFSMCRFGWSKNFLRGASSQGVNLIWSMEAHNLEPPERFRWASQYHGRLHVHAQYSGTSTELCFRFVIHQRNQHARREITGHNRNWARFRARCSIRLAKYAARNHDGGRSMMKLTATMSRSAARQRGGRVHARGHQSIRMRGYFSRAASRANGYLRPPSCRSMQT